MTTHIMTSALPLTDASLADGSLAARLAGPPVLVELSTGWCTPCRLLAPLLPAVGRSFGLRRLAVDADACPALVRHLGVEAFPTLLVIRDGAPAGRLAGFGGHDALWDGLRTILGEPAGDAAGQAFAAAARQAGLAYDEEVAGPQAEAAACLDRIAPELDALQAELARGVAGGRLTDAQSSEWMRAAYHRLTQPFRATLDAAGDAEEAALARYEQAMQAVATRQERGRQQARCRPGSTACRID